MEGQQEPEKKLCSVCKNFFGTEKTEWMCSVCFKKSKPKEQKKVEKPVEKVEVPTAPPKPEQPDRERCQKCNKKVGLLGVECKCGYVFCNMHRIAEEHDCKVDYKQLGQAKISRQNEKVVSRKLSQI